VKKCKITCPFSENIRSGDGRKLPCSWSVSCFLQGVGKIEDGTDGTVAWTRSAITGPQIKRGAEKQTVLRPADFYGQINWHKHFTKCECVAAEAVDGKPCYKVELTTPENQVRTHYYDKASNLLVKSTGIEETQNGKLPAESSIGDYKKVDGLLIPFKVRQKVLTQEILIQLDKVEHNVKLPDNRFDLPDEIKKLAEKENKGQDKPKK
jgi:hypothetical protein